MSNINNYATNTTSLSRSYTKYMVSRILTNSLSDLLEVEVPADLPSDFFAEIYLYSLADNTIVYKDVLYKEQTDVFKVTTLQYQDTSIRRLILIDFSKVSISLPDGRFEVVVNFFVPEIGSPESRSLSVTKISPSRLEVELRLAPDYRTIDNANQLVTFASPQINSKWVIDALKYICNQTQSLNPDIPTEKTRLTFDIIEEFLPLTEISKINSVNTDGQYTASIKNNTQELLNRMYNYATHSVEQQFSTQTRFTENTLGTIISSSLSRAIVEYNQSSNFTFV